MQQIKPLFIAVLSMVCFITVTAANDYKFSRVDAEDGLSNNEIKCIYKDKSGFMWFGTPSGLNRFDGYEVKRIKQDLSETAGHSNNDIEQIQEAVDGKLWITTSYGYMIYDMKKEKFADDVAGLIKKYSGADDFWTLYIDKAGNYWFVTWEDIRMYDVKTEEIKIFNQGERDGLSRGLVVSIIQGENRYWFLFDNGLLECMDAQTQKVIKSDSTLQDMLQQRNITGLRTMRTMLDTSGNLWIYNIGSNFGVMSYSSAKDSWTHYSSSNPKDGYYISNNTVFGLCEDAVGNIWIGTDHGGVAMIDKNGKPGTVILNQKNDPLSLPENVIKCLYRDDLGIVWVGTYKQGVGYYHENIYKFKFKADGSEMPYEDVNAFVEDPLGNLWIGTNGGGLLYFDRKNNTYKQYKHKAGDASTPSGNVIVSLAYDKKGRLWVGHYLNGMDCFDGQRFTNYRSATLESAEVVFENIWDLHCDNAGNLWAGTLNTGVIVFDTESRQLLKHLEVDGAVYAIIEKKSGEILVGTQSGLYVYSVATDKLNNYEREVMTKAQLGRYNINGLLEDSRGLLWIGTRNGLFTFNPYSHEMQLFSYDNGLAADLIQQIEEDANNNIWVSTNRGLSCIQVYTKTEEPGYFFHVDNYDQQDGLQGQQFNFGAGCLTSGSELVFGGMSGFNIFDPVTVINTSGNPRVILTDLLLYNKSIRPDEQYNGKAILTKTISQTDAITLNYSDNYFTLSFAALDYHNTGRSRYYYKLEGFNDQWLEADRESKKVTYTNLNPGKYVFHLKAISNDRSSMEYPVSLQITIRPPFWRTTWAWIVYIALIIGTLLYYWRYTTKKAEKKLRYARERLQTVQQHQIHEMKLRFFTNISHEFRTPLTLILTPLEGLLKKVTDPEDKVTLSIMHRNALQLLRLVNQLLDFRKLDARGHTLNKSLGDIAQFIREQADLFTEAMQRKNIRLTITTNPKHLYLWFDSDKMSKVLINLLFNAHKFTPSGGHIEVEMVREEEENVKIIVSDNGIGIPDESIDRIFDRFYQVKQTDSVNNQDGGSGIGLHLAKEFITLHGGKMWAENIPDGGSRFIIVLPNVEESPSEADLQKAKEEKESSAENDESKKEAVVALSSSFVDETDNHPKLLIVDDNDDFRLFLSGKLKEHYTILEAGDGVVGLDLAFNEIPDMILTDVMMPRMDGIEMSKRVKADIRTSHIPLILLTAKSGEESKLEGLTAGADDYITKPFNMDILMVKIHNLVERNKQQQQVFKEQIKIEPSKITVNSLDERLIKKALEYTESNISNPEFSVEELSRELGMSRVHLYKKMTSLTGKTPIEFIRIVRLKRAAQLLEESQLTISEIAYEVGFNNPKYFRKYFKDEFGVLPSQYGNRNE